MRKRVVGEYKNLLDNNIVCIDNETKIDSSYVYQWYSPVVLETLNDCIKKVLEANPKVIFYNIYYVKKTKRVVFYTDKKVDFGVLRKEQSHSISRKKGSNIVDILNSMLNNNFRPSIEEIDALSLFKIIDAKIKEIKEQQYNFKLELELFLSIKYPNYYFVSDIRYNFMSKSVELTINRKDKLIFQLKSNRVVCLNCKDDYTGINDVLNNIFTFFEKYRSFFTEDIKEVKSINSKFLLDFNSLFIRLKLKNLSQYSILSITKDLTLNEMIIESINNANKLFVEDNTLELLGCIYFKIQDLPIWIQKETLVDEKDKLSKMSFSKTVRRLIRCFKNYLE